MANASGAFEQELVSDPKEELAVELAVVDKPTITYRILQNTLFRECYFIIITDMNSRIISIITPYSNSNDDDEPMQNSILSISKLTVDSIECLNIDRKKHSINDIYNPVECCDKLPNNVSQFTDATDVLKYISNIYSGGNPGKWAGHDLRIDADEDLELYGVYDDILTGKSYGGWILTHKTSHLPMPRILKFNANNFNDTIDVLLESDSETKYGYGLKISYKDHIAYSDRDLTEKIYDRIWHLLHL